MGHWRSALWLLIPCWLLPAGAGAQELTLHRDLPPVAWAGCPPLDTLPAVTAEAEQEAERLVAAASQAAILGEAAEAADLLARAHALDPRSSAIAYRWARAEHELGRTERAVTAYCHYLALSPDGAEAADVRRNVAELAGPRGFAVPADAARAYRSGLSAYDARQFMAADSAFGVALRQSPDWADAIYNRGVARLALGRTDDAVNDLRQYLEMNPGAPEFDRVLDVLGALRGPVTAPYRPGAVAAAGLVVPGLGHFMTSRPSRGMLFLALAGSAVAGGMAVQRTDIECLAATNDGSCPPDQVLRRDSSRPYLMHGIGAAVGIAVLGAIDAYRGAQRANSRAAEVLRLGAGPDAPALEVFAGFRERGNGARLELLRVRF